MEAGEGALKEGGESDLVGLLPCEGGFLVFEVFEFGRGSGLEFVDIGLEEVFEDAGIFGFDDKDMAVEAELESVETGFEFAFTGFGAGALFGIGAVGGEGGFGHGFLAWLDHG